MTERLTNQTSEVQILVKLKLWCIQHLNTSDNKTSLKDSLTSTGFEHWTQQHFWWRKFNTDVIDLKSRMKVN
jgi:hypothetical protein